MAVFIPVEPVNTIASNPTADRVSRMLTESTLLLQKSLARLSSGLKIISAGDDPGGLAQAVRLESVLSRISAAQSNVTNATSFVETQQGFLQEVEEALDRMSELAVLSQDDLTTVEDRSAYQVEFEELQNFVSTVGTKSFNSIALFGASTLSVTIDADANTFQLTPTKFNETGFDGGLADAFDPSAIDISTTASAATAQSQVEIAIDNLALMLGKVGSNVGRLSLESDLLSVQTENLSDVKSAITDVNIAEETIQFARLELLVDSGTTMLAQANLIPSKLLTLLNFE